MKTMIIILLTAFSSVYSFSQSSIYIGTKQYDATRSWPFTIGSYWSQGAGHVQVAEKANGGMIMISMSSWEGNLKGDLLIYLENGTVIKCLDRGIYDNVDNETIGVYYLTQDEMNSLERSDIAKIRFTLKHNVFGMRNYTMSNSYKSFMSTSIFPEKNNTAYDVSHIY